MRDLNNIIKLLVSGGAGGLVLLMGSLVLDVETMKQDHHIMQMDIRVVEAKVNECLARLQGLYGEGRN